MNRAISKFIVAGLAIVYLPFLFYSAIAEEPVYNPDDTSKTILSNGMTVILHETHKSPIVSIDILVKCGSASEARYAGSGISHFVEHLLFKSGDEKETNKVIKEIKSFGGEINGFTTRDHTVYTATVPKDFAVAALGVLKNFVFFPNFDALEIEKERAVILDEIRKNRDDPASSISDLSWSSVFKEHPYKYPIIGYEDLFSRLTKEDIEYYFYHAYSPDNVVMVISGDIKKEGIYAEVDRLFSSVKRYFVTQEPARQEPPQLTKRERSEQKSIKLAYGALSYRSVSVNDSSLYPLDLLAMILGQGEGSILTRELRDTKRLVYSASSSNATLRDGGLFFISFVSEAFNRDPALAATLEILEKIKRDGVAPPDLERAKKMARADFIESLQTAEGRAMDIISSEALTDNYAFSEIYLEKLDTVTSDDIKAVATAYLAENNMNIVRLIPDGEALKEASSGDKEEKSDIRGITHCVLPNGLRAVVCEDHSLPLCTISAIFLGGVRSEAKSDNGVSYLVASLMLDGTKERTEEGIKTKIESMGGSIQSISGMNSLGITLNLMASDWKSGLEILSDAILNSDFNETKILKEKALTLAAIKERDDSIIESGLLLFKESFFKEHPYSMPSLGYAGTVEAIKRDDILKYYGSFVLPSSMVIAATGDINREDFIAQIKKQFGPVKKIDVKFPTISPRGNFQKNEEVTSSMDREQSIILIGFPAVKLTDNDRYAFEVIDSIMSGSDGRLFNNVRSALGVSYSLGSLFMPGIEPGCHIFYAVTASKSIDIAKEAILKEIKRLKAEPVQEKELEAAKRYLAASNVMNLESNASLNLRMAFDELYGLGYDNFERYEAGVNAVTVGQIKRVANQYFDTDKCLIVTVYGKKEGKE